ncbi:MAG: DsbA family protein, partial [Actinomycetota bacterium]
SVRDSVRVRRERAMETRPDTFGLRVDSLRILRAVPRPGAASPPWIVVLSDFQCEPCRRFGLEVIPALRRDIEREGIAHLAFVNAPQPEHFNARFAALAALCAASAGRFWAMHDTLFATLPRWDRDPDPRAFMDSLAVAVGVPAATQRDCTERLRLLHLLDADVRRSARVRGADLPVVYVGDALLPPGDRTLEGVRRAVARAAGAGMAGIGVVTVGERPTRVAVAAMFALGAGMYVGAASAWATAGAAATAAVALAGLARLLPAVRRELA